ncbi:MAG: protein kinase [Pirellula sp.]
MLDSPAAQQFQLGLLALQNQLVSQSTLVTAFESWWADRSRQFGQILVDLGAISAESHLELVKLVADSKRMDDDNSTWQDYDRKRAYGVFDRSVETDVSNAEKNVSIATIKWDPNHSSELQKSVQTQRARNAGSDRFRIVKQHACGGLGVVFLADDQQLHRPVALKQIREDRADSDLIRSKFIQEAEVTGQLEHPGIVPVYALGLDPMGKPYYAMRFIEGQDLGSRIQKLHSDHQRGSEAFVGPILKHVLRRFLDVCDAIEYAHSRGVLHRDLKPANVMLGEFGETLVVDWGLAKMLPGFANSRGCGDSSVAPPPFHPAEEDLAGETMQGQFMGTVAYASPEQLLGQIDQMGPRSDIYSLGAILYELLTGQVAEEKLGPTHTATVLLLHNLGELISDPSLALDVSQRAYSGTLQRYGEDNPETLTTRNSVTANLVLLEKLDEAVPLLEESESQNNRMIATSLSKHRGFERKLEQHAKQVRSVQIRVYLQTERFASAERIARKMLLPEYLEFAGLKPQIARIVLAMALVRQDRHVEADEVLADLRRMPEFKELSTTDLGVALGLQGEMAFAAGDYDEAIALLIDSWERISSGEPQEIYRHVPRYLAITLTKIYERKRDEANRTKWLEKAKSLGFEEK